MKSIAEYENKFGPSLLRNSDLDGLLELSDAYFHAAVGGDLSNYCNSISVEQALDIEELDRIPGYLAGRHELAQEQLARCVMSDKVRLFGLLRVEFNETESGKLFRIKSEQIVDLEIFNVDDDKIIGNFEFEKLFISAGDYLDVFSFGPRRSKLLDKFRAPAKAPSGTSLTIRGRPAKWDWDWLFTEIVALANQPDGLPDKQADLEIWVASQFLEKYNTEPSSSLIRKKVGPIYQRLRSKSQ